ncbi:hypothetical protein SDC9_153862 [bioreactor metagenome]|uniref:Uncharacterized protein n=1 Tax=bioreactor metagenome TaxID=1076179 RepID=A0A645EYU5_9ZZZZ
MPDKTAVVRTGKAPVGHKRGARCKAHAVEVFERLVHFAHARAAFGPLVAYDNDHTGLDFAFEYGLICVLLAFETDGLANEAAHRWVYRAGFRHRRIGRKVAPQYRQTARCVERRVECRNAVEILRVRETVRTQVFAERSTRDGQRVRVQKRRDCLLDARHAAGAEQVVHIGVARRIYTRDNRRRFIKALERVNHVHVKLRLISDGRKVHDSVR